MNPIKSEAELQEDVFGGKSLQDNLRDIIAHNNTGYSYAELLEAVRRREDLLEDDEVAEVDKTVNLLAHLITTLQRQHERELVAVAKVVEAFNNKGSHPHYHDQQMHRLETEWGSLYFAVKELVQLSTNQEGEK